MNVERVLFRLPKDAESLLAAIATLQDYVIQRKDTQLEITLQNPVPAHDYLLAEIPCVELITHECNPVLRGEYELVYEFNPESAYQVAKATKAHITEVFGHQIGCAPASIPSLDKLLSANYVPSDCVGVLTSSLFNEMRELVISKQIPARWIEWSDTSQELNQHSFERLAECSIVVGHMSAATYAAAALGRHVIEIYPTTVHKEWLSKWMADDYKMVYTSQPDYAMLAKVVEETWRTRKIVPAAVSV